MTVQDNNNTNGNNSANNGNHLGLAGNMAKAFIHSPLSPLLFFAMLAMGILGLIFTPRQEDPQISVPMVDIFVSYQGASAEQVASLAIDPLERIMSEIPGIKHVYSASRHSQGMVTVQFEVGEQLGPSIVKVHDKIQSNLDKMPPGVAMPLVKPKGIDDVPVVTLTLWSSSVDDGILRTLGLDLLQSLKQIPNTGQGFIVGGRAEQVRVEVMPERLSGYGISLDQVANTIRTANSEMNAGSLESSARYFTVNTGAFLENANDISRLVVTTHDNVPVYVSDVARVTQEPEETTQLVQFYTGPAYSGEETANALPAVTVAISKKEGTNGVTVANAIIAKVEELKGQLLPDNVNIDITRNYGETADDKVNELIFKLFIATIIVGFLIWGALGIRPAIVVLFVIPVVILITVFSAWVMGYTIDRVSLFALIFSIGILVDDAIVVIENIYRRWLEKGEMDTDTAVDAVREVGNPTILATFTVIAALLPMGFVSGMMGPYMEPIPALGSVAMLFSLFAAFIFTPWLAMRIRPSMAKLQQMEDKEHKSNEQLERLFRKVLIPIIENKALGWLTLGSIIAIFFLSCVLFYTTSVTVKMLPLDNKPEFSIVIDMPEGTALPDTANLTTHLADIMRKVPEVTAIQSYVGTAQPYDFNGMVRHYYLRGEPWQAELHIQLLHKRDRERSSHEIAVAARKELTPLAREAGAKITVVEMPPGPPVLQAMVAEVYGPDAETRRIVAQRITEAFEEAENVADVDNYMQAPYDKWRFEVDTEKAVRRGVTVDTINRNLSMAMGGYKLGDIKQGTVLEPTYIVMQVPLEVRSKIGRLSDMPIPTGDGSTVPLAELGQFVKVPEDPIIYHKDLRPIEYVVGEAVGRLAAPIYGMFEVEDLLNDYVTPDGVTLSGEYLGPPKSDNTSGFEWTGEWTVTYETFRDMGAAFGVALILIYILVVWEFGNFMVPAIIMAPIPLTLIGIVPGHWILGAEFTATSMIGFIALAGIIVRNSILLVDFSLHQVAKGMSSQDSVIMACKTRTRPIMITAFALVGGSSVILTDPIFQGMAISLLFGVLVSTLLTLVVIPLGCISARKVFCITPDGESCDNGSATQSNEPKDPLWLRVWNIAYLVIFVLFSVLSDLFGYVKKTFVSIAKLSQRQKAAATNVEFKTSASLGAANVLTEERKDVSSNTSEKRQGDVEQVQPEAVTLQAEEAAPEAADRGDAVSVAKKKSSKKATASKKSAATRSAAAEAESVEIDSVDSESGEQAETAPEKESVAKKSAPKKAVIKRAPSKKVAVKKKAVKKAISKAKHVEPEAEITAESKEEKSVRPDDNSDSTAAKKSKRRGIRLKKDLT